MKFLILKSIKHIRILILIGIIFSNCKIFGAPQHDLTGSYNCEGKFLDIQKLESFPVGYMIWLEQFPGPITIEEQSLSIEFDRALGSSSIDINHREGHFLFNDCSPMELIGGNNARKGQFKGVVQIRGACTARRVGDRSYLTAGHCVASQGSARPSDMIMPPFTKGKNIHIKAGTNLSKSYTVQIEQTHVHRKYVELLKNGKDNGPDAHDVAVIEVKQSIDHNELPIGDFSYDPLNIREKIVLAGYGCQGDKYTPSAEDSGVLKFGTVTLDRMYGSVGVSSDMATRVCSGDSGSSAFVGNSQSGYVTIGVNSYKWVRKNQASVFTLLSNPEVKKFLQPIIGPGSSLGAPSTAAIPAPAATPTIGKISLSVQSVISELNRLRAEEHSSFHCLKKDDIGIPSPGRVSVWSYANEDFVTINIAALDNSNLDAIIGRFENANLCNKESR